MCFRFIMYIKRTSARIPIMKRIMPAMIPVVVPISLSLLDTVTAVGVSITKTDNGYNRSLLAVS